MSAIFELPLADETLSQEELHRITGYAHNGDQARWLKDAGWVFHTNKGGAPIVGRLYARLKMAGITPSALTSSGGWAPDFSHMQ
jgi:hypothetical protein